MVDMPASSSAPAPNSGPTTSTAVKRACDACHRRKVKCDGLNPCRNCASAQLSCTYHAIPQKKGPKGSRAKVISELRETQRQTTLSTKVANRLNGIASPPHSPSLTPTPGLLTNEIIKECIEFFFNNMYPTMPILHKQRLQQQVTFVDRNIETYCLMTSLCSFMMIQPGMPIPGDPLGLDSMPGANLVSGTMLMEETLRVRKAYDHLENPSIMSLITSFFLFGCYFGLDMHNKAWFHLREATTLAHILEMNKEESYLQFDAIDASRRRRLYWLLFVTERAYALQRHRPLTLQATITLPQPNEDPTELTPPLAGFVHLVSIYRPFDDMFIALWNKTRNDCSPTYLAALQKQLTEALPTYLNSTSCQQSDLRTSQQWLRTMVWQLSIQNGCLSSSNDDPCMTFQYPVEISRDLVSMTSQFTAHSMEVHGIGLIEKLFDVACSLTDVLSLLPPPSDPFTLGPRDYLTQFLALLGTLRNGDSRFLPLLLQKVHDVLPRLASPMLQNVPEPAQNQQACEIDIFDGFGNAGMGVASSLPLHFDNKDLSSISDGSSSSDNTPFTSPPILSTGMDFTAAMGQYGAFQDMSSPMENGTTTSRPNSMQGQRALPRGPPLHQNSHNSTFNVVPRSVPEPQPATSQPLHQHAMHSFQHVQRNGEGLEHMLSIGESEIMRQRQRQLHQQQQRQSPHTGHLGFGGEMGMTSAYR